MLTKYALVAIIVLCITVLGFTLLVRSSLCELSIKERSIEFKAVLAYESKKYHPRGGNPAYWLSGRILLHPFLVC